MWDSPEATFSSICRFPSLFSSEPVILMNTPYPLKPSIESNSKWLKDQFFFSRAHFPFALLKPQPSPEKSAIALLSGTGELITEVFCEAAILLFLEVLHLEMLFSQEEHSMRRGHCTQHCLGVVKLRSSSVVLNLPTPTTL